MEIYQGKLQTQPKRSRDIVVYVSPCRQESRQAIRVFGQTCGRSRTTPTVWNGVFHSSDAGTLVCVVVCWKPDVNLVAE